MIAVQRALSIQLEHSDIITSNEITGLGQNHRDAWLKNVAPAARQMESGALIYCQMCPAAISCLVFSYSKKITLAD